MTHAILCVDDELDNVEALERLFRKNFKVFKATSAKDGLKILAENPITVIISDQRMPQMSGVEFLAESIKTHPFAIRILLTGYTDINSVIDAINSGQVYRYVTKPWDSVDLTTAVQRAVERYELSAELREKNAALQKALDELQTLDQAKTEFMMLVNHELKTPLTAILSFGDLLAETELDADQKKYLSRIRSSTERLQNLVNDSLELVAAQTGQTKVSVKKHAADALLAEAPAVVQDLCNKRHLKLAFALSKASVQTDEKIIQNVMLRLLHNAVKFADEESTVHVRGASTPTGTYKVELENKGAAIDPKRIEQIFKPFTLNEKMLHHTTGTGLGLSISQALLKRLGSTLQIESKSGTVRVSFELPATVN